MKIQPSHYAFLEEHINKVLADHPEAYRAYIDPSLKAKDPEVRWRWDLFWAIPPHVRESLRDDPLWWDLSDAHIDTALRRLVPTLKQLAALCEQRERS